MAISPYVKILYDGAKEYNGSAAPSASTDGTFEVADFVRNSAPSAGEAYGWVCVVRGAPGTWKAVEGIAS